MSKNSYKANVNQYANREEEIRKAKGNPNKNIHKKKGNSNYGGYTAGNYMADKLAQKMKDKEQVKLPTWQKVTLAVLFVVLIVLLVLRMTVWKENILMSYVTTILLGAACGVLFYVRRFNHKQREKAGYKAVQVLLAVIAALYIGMGAMGLVAYFG